MTEVSSTRLYLGNLPRNASKQDVEAHFNTHGTGEITEIKLMNGFGFIEYKDAMDARDVVPAFHGSDFMGERLTVQFARGTRSRDVFDRPALAAPRPRRTPHRMQISGLPGETSWQDLKDFARQSSLDVVYSETGRDRDGKGSFVEFETAADLKTAVEKLDGREFKGVTVHCIADTQPDVPGGSDRGDARARSMSPRRGYGGRGSRRPPYSPHREGARRDYPRDDYRDRSDRRSPPRGSYDDYDRGRYPPRSPPRGGGRGPPADDYPPRRGGGYDDGYRGRDFPAADPYVNGHSSRPPYDRPPPRDYPAREAGYDYDRRNGGGRY